MPLPTSIGSASLPTLSPITTCRGDNGTLSVTFALTPELKAYREVSVVNVSFGDFLRVGSYQDPWLEQAQPTISIPVTCTEGAKVTGTIVATARVAGTSADEAPPPLQVNVDVPCPPKAEWVPCSHDGGMFFFGDAGASVVDAGADTPAAQQKPSGNPGCRFGGNTSNASSIIALVVAMAAVAWRKRRT